MSARVVSEMVISRHVGVVAEITLNRPERLNALCPELLEALRDSVHLAERDSGVGAILLSGAGRAFCAGQDLALRDPRVVDWPLDLERIQIDFFHPVLRQMRASTKPIIVALNGIASGAGASIALAGDIVIAAQTSKLSFSFARVGLSADAGCAWFLERAVGPAKARHLLLTAATLSAQQAHTARLVAEVVPDEALHCYCRAFAAQLADGPRTAHSLIKHAVELASRAPFDDYLVGEAKLQGIAGRTDDYREGVLAFLDKRTPSFKKS